MTFLYINTFLNLSVKQIQNREDRITFKIFWWHTWDCTCMNNVYDSCIINLLLVHIFHMQLFHCCLLQFGHLCTGLPKLISQQSWSFGIFVLHLKCFRDGRTKTSCSPQCLIDLKCIWFWILWYRVAFTAQGPTVNHKLWFSYLPVPLKAPLGSPVMTSGAGCLHLSSSIEKLKVLS